jgi:NodT family efflux transporter outer membrane factor (OMF) lipoprotein
MRYPQNAAATCMTRPLPASSVTNLLRRLAVAVCVIMLLPLTGCTPLGEYIRNGFKVGPNYQTPPAPVAPNWIDANDLHLRNTTEELSDWWKVFGDPQLNSLVCAAYNQNLTLRQAGFAILQARAERAIAVGELFPQQQQATADYLREASSQQTVGRSASSAVNRFFSQWDYGFNLSWELDFWGRFRRAVESANGNLDASVANYDAALVTLIGDVASTYVDMCTTQQRIKYVNMNIELQSQVVKSVKLNPMATSVDYQQALSTLRQTEALLPPLLITLRQDNDKLCTLLGIPIEDLTPRLVLARIPEAPTEVVVGIPADLLRRRPDVRRAERQAASQSAVIGVAEAEFYPHIAINGTIGAAAAEFKHLFLPTAFTGTIGPSFRWDILNYGRILNEVRREDAIFKQLVLAYQNTVLSANAEVENALIVYLRSRDQYQKLKESADATQLAVKVLAEQMKAGLIDFNRMALLQQNLTQQLDTEAVALGNVAQGLIQVYRALGGGWQLRVTGACDPQGNCPGRLGPPIETDSEPLGPPRVLPPQAPAGPGVP